MTIHSMPNNKNYLDNYDRIFKKPEKVEDYRDVTVNGCFCTGPEPGQTMCPCALRMERQRKERDS